MVRSAQDGDTQAVRALVADHLPLLYTLVTRAAGPAVDVGDVLGRTATLAAAGMPGLADPENFRPWLLGAALRFLWTAEEASGDPMWPVAVTGDDADQREQALAAIHWLVADDRELLSMWWLEASGELTRAEVVAACGLSPAQAETRLRQVEARFEDARTVIRTLGATPPCTALAALLQHWDGRPSDRQRRQIARHATDCTHCSARADDLIPADRLLRGTPLVAPPPALRDALLDLCERPASATASSGLLDRARRALGVPWVATAARVVAVTVAVVLLITTLMTYADSRKSRPTPAGLSGTPPTASSVRASSTGASSTGTAPAGAPVDASPGTSRGASPKAPGGASRAPAAGGPSATALVPVGPHSLRPGASPNGYVRVVNQLAFVLPLVASDPVSAKQAATFAVVTGLTDPSCRSFRGPSGQYLRHYRFRVRLDADDKTEVFRKDATFCVRPGANAKSVTFQSVNYPDQYLHLRGDELWIDKSDGTAGFLAASSFQVVGPWAT